MLVQLHTHNNKEKVVSATILTYKNIGSIQSDFVVGDIGMNELKQHASALNQASMGAKNLHGSGQITHPSSSKSTDSMDNIEFELQNDREKPNGWFLDLIVMSH
jgi:hypothetical protein